MSEKTKVLSIIFIIVFVLIISVMATSYRSDDTQQQTYAHTYDTPTIYNHRVTYRVTGYSSKGVSVTYSNAGGDTEQKDVTLPWSWILYPMHDGDFVYISAQVNSEYGDITVEIYLDGVLTKTSSSYGAYVIATASGII